MLKPAVRRSACDQCRAKRVRCLRAQDSMAPCARCCYMRAPCVTSAPGRPGRPPKQTSVDSNDTPSPRRSVTSPISSPVSHSASTVRDLPQDETHVPAPTRKPPFRTGRRISEDTLYRIAAPQLAAPKSPTPSASPRNSLPLEVQADFWAAPGNSATFFGSHSTHDSPVLAQDMIPWLLDPDNQLNSLMQIDEAASSALDINIDPVLQYDESLVPLAPLQQSSGTASALIAFREDVDRRITMVDIYYSEPTKVVQRCKDDDPGRDVENPAAALLTCCKKFIDIIQNLIPADRLHGDTEDVLSTEILLLVLSSYLALMRLFDSLFHRIYKYLCQVSPESYLSIRVKSVLRIGGVSSLQDMPLKTYALGILDAIQCQVQTLERCMGIPAEYCLSDDAAASSTTAAPGIFSRVDRTRLFWTVMAQEDVKSWRGTKSYVESIRVSIKESMAFLDD